MADPAEHIPADGHLRQRDGDFEFGAFGVAMARTGAVGAVVELANQLHRPLERMNTAVAVVADIHHAPTNGTSTVQDVEFPLRKIRIGGPLVRHRADLHAVLRSIAWASMEESMQGKLELPALCRAVW